MVSESTVRMDRMSNRTVKDGRNQVIKGSEKTFLYASRARTKKTRMHSSRMCTGRSLTICWRLLPGGGGLGVPGPGGVVCSRGGTWFGGYLVRGSLVWGGLLQGGSGLGEGGGLLLGGCLVWGGLLRGEVVCSGGVWCGGGGLVCSRGRGAWSGGPGPRGVCSGGGCIPACTEADPPPVDRILDTRL